MLEEPDIIQIEIQREAGLFGSLKLYVHINGQTVLRVARLKAPQIEIIGTALTKLIT